VGAGLDVETTNGGVKRLSSIRCASRRALATGDANRLSVTVQGPLSSEIAENIGAGEPAHQGQDQERRHACDQEINLEKPLHQGAG
jgi:hypothetical protein